MKQYSKPRIKGKTQQINQGKGQAYAEAYGMAAERMLLERIKAEFAEMTTFLAKYSSHPGQGLRFDNLPPITHDPEE